MSDDLVARLHENPDDILTTRLRAYYTSAETRAEAADRIEALEAERDILAEIVRLLNVSVEPHSSVEAVWWLITDDDDPALTPDQAERFRAVLDRITKEASDERCPAGICRRPAGHAGPHSDLPREGGR